jgi:hypothetical protein|tara:strand:- start:144 stop:461 length:318 start_codon:yes stop_codon:yes gene_type:complete
MILVILMSVIIPILFGLLHTIAGVYLIYTKGNMTALGWNMLGFLTKTIFMLFMTYMGVSVLEFDFRIYVPILSFVWFMTHIAEAFYIQYHMNENCSETLKSILMK